METTKPTPVQQEREVSFEIRAFCALVTRIMLRCLKEQDPSSLKRLGWEHLKKGTSDELQEPAA